MNKFFSLILSIFLTSGLFISCQNNERKSNYEHYRKVFDNALNVGDIRVAIDACHNIIADDSTRTNYYDTLVTLYLNTDNFAATYNATRECLKYYPKNDKMTRVAALFAKKLEMPDTAIMFYRQTYVINKKLENLYDVAVIQYEDGNYSAAEETANIIIKDPEGMKERVPIAANNEQSQLIPLKAAALSLKGAMYIEMGNKEIALRYIDEALIIAPDFKVAKNNKEQILIGKIKFKK